MEHAARDAGPALGRSGRTLTRHGRSDDMASAPIILVPGFWLGAWAWDEVAALLRADGHDVTALTLPGLESKDADRSGVTFADHVDTIVGALRAAPAPAVLALHSATGFSGYAASDVVPELHRGDRLRRHRARQGRPGSRVRGRREADGLGRDQGRGEPRRPQRGPARHVPRTRRARARRPAPGRAHVHERRPQRHPGDHPRDRVQRGGLPEVRQRGSRAGRSSPGSASCAMSTWIDLPTSHWPMWSRPADTARIIGDVATRAGEGG